MTVDLDARYRFETYVVGTGNRLAVSAARAVAQAPGAAYNPLFIYSGSGLGKTHLMLAIAHLALQRQPGLRAEYTTVDEFVEELNGAVAAGTMDALKRRYQEVGLLLLDDVQFLAGRREMQSEMLRLFNVLQRSGRQVVLASDRPPGDIADLDDRLTTRFAGGLVVDVGEPDYETRVAILRMRSEERAAQFNPGVLEEVARLRFRNVRELQGALNRLIAHQTLGESPLTPATVRELLGERGDGVVRATPVRAQASEFDTLLSDVSEVLSQQLEAWRIRVSEAITYWHELGYHAGRLERALDGASEPDVDALLTDYEAAIARLRDLQQTAAKFDHRLATSELFLDPERVSEAELVVARLIGTVDPPPGPRVEFTRAEFDVGPSNQLAVHAADTVVQEPGGKYNPLYLHGPSGVGKTHLLHAVGNELVATRGGAALVACVNARDFTDELIRALQDGTIERWRVRYRVLDVLLMDDVQQLTGSERTQDELFHLFNSLYAAGRQIVLAADRAPGRIEGLEDRLRSRFEGGLVVEMQRPDHALREKFFARQLAASGQRVDHALLEYLASRPVGSVAEVSALVTRLRKAADIVGVPLTAGLARKELEGSFAAPTVTRSTPGRSVDESFLDEEKVVWEWPELSGRAIEEYR